jgi:hypothetical protein
VRPASTAGVEGELMAPDTTSGAAGQLGWNGAVPGTSVTVPRPPYRSA